jgi:flagellar basal body-associated protein FliL
VKIIITPKTKPSQYLYIGLLSLAGVLVLLIIIGTIIGLARSSNAKPLFRLGKPGAHLAQTPARTAASGDDIRVFSGLGRMRIPLSNSSTLILSIAFPYPAHDTAFTEELAAKIGDFRSLAAGYFSALPADKIVNLDEEAAKQEILARYNATLRLGRISTLYFSDMTVLDGNL